mmetsp:Transcript_22492/g.63731  ORF Transcript_22492/g.63731 Transcript_22492/m.63731 type:complete len:595 (-) Transcript_22492:114-1898(-)
MHAAMSSSSQATASDNGNGNGSPCALGGDGRRLHAGTAWQMQMTAITNDDGRTRTIDRSSTYDSGKEEREACPQTGGTAVVESAAQSPAGTAPPSALASASTTATEVADSHHNNRDCRRSRHLRRRSRNGMPACCGAGDADAGCAGSSNSTGDATSNGSSSGAACTASTNSSTTTTSVDDDMDIAGFETTATAATTTATSRSLASARLQSAGLGCQIQSCPNKSTPPQDEATSSSEEDCDRDYFTSISLKNLSIHSDTVATSELSVDTISQPQSPDSASASASAPAQVTRLDAAFPMPLPPPPPHEAAPASLADNPFLINLRNSTSSNNSFRGGRRSPSRFRATRSSSFSSPSSTSAAALNTASPSSAEYQNRLSHPFPLVSIRPRRPRRRNHNSSNSAMSSTSPQSFLPQPQPAPEFLAATTSHGQQQGQPPAMAVRRVSDDTDSSGDSNGTTDSNGAPSLDGTSMSCKTGDNKHHLSISLDEVEIVPASIQRLSCLASRGTATTDRMGLDDTTKVNHGEKESPRREKRRSSQVSQLPSCRSMQPFHPLHTSTNAPSDQDRLRVKRRRTANRHRAMGANDFDAILTQIIPTTL